MGITFGVKKILKWKFGWPWSFEICQNYFNKSSSKSTPWWIFIALVGYINYSNLTNYYFSNYDHWVLHYIVDYYIDFDHLVHYSLTTICFSTIGIFACITCIGIIYFKGQLSLIALLRHWYVLWSLALQIQQNFNYNLHSFMKLPSLK
jgi:hypothetical protein